MTTPVTAEVAAPLGTAQANLTDLAHDQAAAVAGVLEVGDAERLAATFGTWALLIAAIIHSYGYAAAAIAADIYTRRRAALGRTAGRFAPIIAAPAAAEQVTGSLRWAVFTGSDPTTDRAATDVHVGGIVARLVQEPARATITGSVAADPAATGWARIPQAGACGMCRLAQIRGGAYRGAASAGETDGFHDHCRCTVAPVFAGQRFEPDAAARTAARAYEQTPVARTAPGFITAYERQLARAGLL